MANRNVVIGLGCGICVGVYALLAVYHAGKLSAFKWVNEQIRETIEKFKKENKEES